MEMALHPTLDSLMTWCSPLHPIFSHALGTAVGRNSDNYAGRSLAPVLPRSLSASIQIPPNPLAPVYAPIPQN